MSFFGQNLTVDANGQPYATSGVGAGVHPGALTQEQAAANAVAAAQGSPTAGSNFGSYGDAWMGGAYDPTLNQATSVDPTQSVGERVDERKNNFMYGGTPTGAADAIAAARGNIDPYTTNLGNMGQGFYGASQQGTTGMYGAADSLMGYAQQGPGPSVAQAQLEANNAAAMRQQLAMAGSGRGAGGGASAYRQAMANQANIAGQGNAQAAMLQAQEAQDWRQAQLGAMQGAGALYGQGATGLGGLGVGATQGAGQLQQGTEGLAHTINMGDLNASMGYEGNLTNIYGIDKGVAAQKDLAAQQAAQAQEAALYNAGATALTLAATSDERAKTNIESAEGSGLDMLASLGSHSYDYKEPEKHGEGRFFGPMAQELERTAAGRSAVIERDGVKMVDTGRLSLSLASAMAEMQRKLEKRGVL
jgi:hypothetical protein